jgi:hypothetical protein
MRPTCVGPTQAGRAQLHPLPAAQAQATAELGQENCAVHNGKLPRHLRKSTETNMHLAGLLCKQWRPLRGP